MKAVITRDLVEGIVRSSNAEFVESTDQKVQALLSNAIEKLSKTVPYINFDNAYLQPINEVLTGGFTDNSSMVYFLGVDNAQIEFNTLKGEDVWKKLRNRVVSAWQDRKKKKKKRKKKKEVIEPEKPRIFDPETYTILKLAEDLQETCAEFLSNTSIVYLEGKRIRIIGKDDFGASTNIIIYPVLYNGKTFRFFKDRKRGFIKINNDLRVAKIEEKVEKVGVSFIQLIKILNVLYYNTNKTLPNQIFIESLLYNCPDHLFSEEVYDSFVKVINYLSMTNIKDFESIINPNKTIFTDELCGNNMLGYKKLINKLIDMKLD